MKSSIQKEFIINDNKIFRIESIEDMREILFEFDKIFEPSLSESITSLDDYASKLFNNAIVFAAIEKGEFTGFIAFYANDIKHRLCYLTQIAVKNNFQNRKIGKILLNLCINYSKDIGMSEIKLEVKNHNMKAINFYKRNGFKFFEKATVDSKYMIKKL